MDYQKTSISDCSGSDLKLTKIRSRATSKLNSPNCINATENVEEAINNFSVILPNLIVENTENGISEALILSRTPSLNRKAHSSPIHEQRRHSDDGYSYATGLDCNVRSSHSAHHVGRNALCVKLHIYKSSSHAINRCEMHLLL